MRTGSTTRQASSWVLVEVARALRARSGTGPTRRQLPSRLGRTGSARPGRPSARRASIRAVAIVRDIRDGSPTTRRTEPLFARPSGSTRTKLAGAADRARVDVAARALRATTSFFARLLPDRGLAPDQSERRSRSTACDGGAHRLDRGARRPSGYGPTRPRRHLGTPSFIWSGPRCPAPRRWRLVRHRLPGGAREVLLDGSRHTASTPRRGPGRIHRRPGPGASGSERVKDRPSNGGSRPRPRRDDTSSRPSRRADESRSRSTSRSSSSSTCAATKLEVVARKPLHGDDGDHAWFCGPETLTSRSGDIGDFAVLASSMVTSSRRHRCSS